MQRIDIIKTRLIQKFAPEILHVIDDSAQHVGHAGSQGGAGHYTIEIKSQAFQTTSRVQQHREIYAALNDLIPHEIHALQIKIFP